MSSLEAIAVQTLLVGGLVNLLSATIALYLWNERRSELFLLFWSFAWMTGSIRWATSYVALGERALFPFLSFQSAVLHFFIVLGCYNLLSRKLWKSAPLLMATAIVLLAFTVLGLMFEIPSEMEYARFLTVLLFWAGSMFYAFRTERLPGYAFAAGTLALWGTYVGIALAVLGKGIATHVVVPLFNVPLAFSIIVIAYQRSRRALVQSEERRRRAEQELQQEREELAHAQRVATLGELGASFAHELGQPLAAILLHAQAALRFIEKPKASGEIREALVDIVTSVRNASEIIDRLRALSRKEHTQHALLDVNGVIEDTLRLLKSDLLRTDIDVNFEPGQSLPQVFGDPVQLRQVWLNVLVNAEQAISAAGRGPREIHIQTGVDSAGDVLIDVRDSGTGLPETELERIFTHFVTSKPQGLGMGLAISRTIVQSHGGRIWASRNSERGLTLHVALPAAVRHDQ
jgi:signal transduction histidine kinase